MTQDEHALIIDAFKRKQALDADLDRSGTVKAVINNGMGLLSFVGASQEAH